LIPESLICLDQSFGLEGDSLGLVDGELEGFDDGDKVGVLDGE
jgi:hypothetical protein